MLRTLERIVPSFPATLSDSSPHWTLRRKPTATSERATMSSGFSNGIRVFRGCRALLLRRNLLLPSPPPLSNRRRSRSRTLSRRRRLLRGPMLRLQPHPSRNFKGRWLDRQGYWKSSRFLQRWAISWVYRRLLAPTPSSRSGPISSSITFRFLSYFQCYLCIWSRRLLSRLEPLWFLGKWCCPRYLMNPLVDLLILKSIRREIWFQVTKLVSAASFLLLPMLQVNLGTRLPWWKMGFWLVSV